ncbi:MAG: glycosyltransferase [Lachnospiraceae bacterium]|nr:glycosyltransferase [Lachnospiraceae bacterium]
MRTEAVTNGNDRTVDVLIPVYRPDDKLKQIIERLEKQDHPVSHIILINTGKQYFDDFFKNDGFLEGFDNIIIHHITEEEFDHGATRRLAVSMSHADIFVCMTDDAVPRDRHLISRLIKPIVEGNATSAYARQLPGKTSSVYEAANRHFNYPAVSMIKGREDLKRLGIKTFFCSDVCAAYDRHVYDSLGGFENHMIFNEDMVYARHVIDAGHHIAYVAEAQVIHSHDYRAGLYFRRSFDMGVSQAMYPEVFDVSSESEGMKLIKRTCTFYIRKKKFLLIPQMIFINGLKFLGYRLGKSYKKLPKRVILAATQNKVFWTK